MQQDVLLLRSYRQVQHQRIEQTSQRHQQGSVRGGAHQSSDGSGKNRGFRVRHSTVLMYVQERAALTYFYAKHMVYEDGVTTSPDKAMHSGRLS